MSKYYILSNIIYTNLQKWLIYDNNAKLTKEGYLGKPVVAYPKGFQIIPNILHFIVVKVISNKGEIFLRKKS